MKATTVTAKTPTTEATEQVKTKALLTTATATQMTAPQTTVALPPVATAILAGSTALSATASSSWLPGDPFSTSSNQPTSVTFKPLSTNPEAHISLQTESFTLSTIHFTWKIIESDAASPSTVRFLSTASFPSHTSNHESTAFDLHSVETTKYLEATTEELTIGNSATSISSKNFLTFISCIKYSIGVNSF